MDARSKYTQDGVNVKEGDKFSAFAGKICRDSFLNSPYVEVLDPSAGYFRGIRSFRLCNLPAKITQELATDGNGTKSILNDAVLKHWWAGFDLMAMCAGDISRNGGLPLLMNNQLDVATLGEEGDPTNMALRSLLKGLSEAAKIEKVVLYRGETAEMGVCIGTDNPQALAPFNWSASVLGVYHENNMITGADLAEGQLIIAFEEKGFRANGMSSVRKALGRQFFEDWFNNPAAQDHIEAAAMPSTLYDPFLTTLNGWYNVEDDFEPLIRLHKIVHVTGGAFRGKLGDDILFPRGLSADLSDLWAPPAIMKCCKFWRGMTDQECYDTWNGGNGILTIASPIDADDIVSRAKDFNLRGKICGEITKTPDGKKPSIRIQSKFTEGCEVIYTAD